MQLYSNNCPTWVRATLLLSNLLNSIVLQGVDGLDPLEDPVERKSRNESERDREQKHGRVVGLGVADDLGGDIQHS